ARCYSTRAHHDKGGSNAAGQVHYSNIHGHVPAQAATWATSRPCPRRWRHAVGRPRAALRGASDFYAEVRPRQRARSGADANSTLLPDWNVADRWLRLKDEEGRPRAGTPSARPTSR